MSKTVKLLFVSLLVFAFSAVALAQSTTTGSVGGVVTNPAKEVVSGATVTVKNIGTNREGHYHRRHRTFQVQTCNPEITP